jgi:hypothetical protein
VYVYGAEHGIGIMLLRCAYHFTFQKGGIILPPGTVCALCLK